MWITNVPATPIIANALIIFGTHRRKQVYPSVKDAGMILHVNELLPETWEIDPFFG